MQDAKQALQPLFKEFSEKLDSYANDPRCPIDGPLYLDIEQAFIEDRFVPFLETTGLPVEAIVRECAHTSCFDLMRFRIIEMVWSRALLDCPAMLNQLNAETAKTLSKLVVERLDGFLGREAPRFVLPKEAGTFKALQHQRWRQLRALFSLPSRATQTDHLFTNNSRRDLRALLRSTSPMEKRAREQGDWNRYHRFECAFIKVTFHQYLESTHLSINELIRECAETAGFDSKAMRMIEYLWANYVIQQHPTHRHLARPAQEEYTALRELLVQKIHWIARVDSSEQIDFTNRALPCLISSRDMALNPPQVVDRLERLYQLVTSPIEERLRKETSYRLPLKRTLFADEKKPSSKRRCSSLSTELARREREVPEIKQSQFVTTPGFAVPELSSASFTRSVPTPPRFFTMHPPSHSTPTGVTPNNLLTPRATQEAFTDEQIREIEERARARYREELQQKQETYKSRKR